MSYFMKNQRYLDCLTLHAGSYPNVPHLALAGQIELFTHVPVLRNFVEYLKRKNFTVCAVYLLDSQVWITNVLFLYNNTELKTQTNICLFFLVQFVSDVTKYISGWMASLSAMIQLELPHINILSKLDLVSNNKDVEEYVLFNFFLPYLAVTF